MLVKNIRRTERPGSRPAFHALSEKMHLCKSTLHRVAHLPRQKCFFQAYMTLLCAIKVAMPRVDSSSAFAHGAVALLMFFLPNFALSNSDLLFLEVLCPRLFSMQSACNIHVKCMCVLAEKRSFTALKMRKFYLQTLNLSQCTRALLIRT